jgi:glyoxylase-like metal-dependent hydrolase (beta-lactamase superfamily II)
MLKISQIISKKYVFLALCSSALFSASLSANERFAKVDIKPTEVAKNVYMLEGMGGNIGVSAGKDGVLIIDDQFAPLAEKIQNELGNIHPKPVSYVINTHFHGDHTGGNAHFHDSNGATIFAHHNVRVRLLNDDKTPESKLPVVTYNDGITFHFNDDELVVSHYAGHTDGDSVVYFKNTNVLHTGDLFFNGLFPFVDLDNGGDVQAYIDSVKRLLTLINDNTVIIPGHGPIAKRADYQDFVTMMEATFYAVKAQKAQGLTLEQVLENGVAEQYKSFAWNFISEKRWLTTLFRSA